MEQEISQESINDEYFEGIRGVVEYLVSIHNALNEVVLGTHKENEELLVIHSVPYQQIVENILDKCVTLGSIVGMEIEPTSVTPEQ